MVCRTPPSTVKTFSVCGQNVEKRFDGFDEKKKLLISINKPWMFTYKSGLRVFFCQVFRLKFAASPNRSPLGIRRFWPAPVLLAVQPLDLEVRVEVEDDALRWFRCCDDPVAVLVRRVLQGVARRGDVARLAGVQDPSTRRHRYGESTKGLVSRNGKW